jgi:hypothetical protein
MRVGGGVERSMRTGAGAGEGDEIIGRELICGVIGEGAGRPKFREGDGSAEVTERGGVALGLGSGVTRGVICGVASVNGRRVPGSIERGAGAGVAGVIARGGLLFTGRGVLLICGRDTIRGFVCAGDGADVIGLGAPVVGAGVDVAGDGIEVIGPGVPVTGREAIGERVGVRSPRVEGSTGCG